MWFVSRRGHEDEIAKLRRRVLATEARHDEAARAHNQLAKKLADEETANKRLAEELAAVTIVNTCLTDDLVAARERLAEVEAASCDTAAAQWQAQARREKKRADALQKAYDDAVGLKPRGIEDSSRWQPGYVAPKADAS